MLEVVSPNNIPCGIRFDDLIREGFVTDQAELARLGHVSRMKLTQIMNRLCLAPDLQEQILFLPATEHGWDAIEERDLRSSADRGGG